MIKPMLLFLLVFCLFCGGSTAVYAAEDSTRVVVEDNSAQSSAAAPPSAGTPAPDTAPDGGLVQVEDAKPQIYPQDVKTVTENGIAQIHKTYEVPPDFDPQKLIVEPFEQNGFTFTQSEIYKKALPGEVETRLASNTITVQSEDDNHAAILKQLSPILEYEESGFTGQLRLDASTLFTEAEGYETYSYTVTKTKDYNALDRNDPVHMEKKMNGLKLMDVDWSAQREEHWG